MDPDLLRHHIVPKTIKISEDYKCTLEEELLPPVFRPNVRKLLEEGRRRVEKYDRGTDIITID